MEILTANLFTYYRPQRSCGKAMFSQMSVILFTGGRGSLSGRPPDRDPPGQIPPWTETLQTETPWTETPQTETPRQTPSGQRPPPDRDPLHRDPRQRPPRQRPPWTETPSYGNERTVRILRKCNLIYCKGS